LELDADKPLAGSGLHELVRRLGGIRDLDDGDVELAALLFAVSLPLAAEAAALSFGLSTTVLPVLQAARVSAPTAAATAAAVLIRACMVPPRTVLDVRVHTPAASVTAGFTG
jgi:hypothetical protein